MNSSDISRIAVLFKDAAQAMLAIVLRGGGERELARERDSLLSRLLRVILDVTPRTYAEGGREALSEPTWEPGPEHREAVQAKADDLAGELSKLARGMEADAGRMLAAGEAGVEEARQRGVRYIDPAGRSQDPEYWSRMLAATHDAVIKNAGHVNAAASIGSPGVLVRDGGNPVNDSRACSVCIPLDGERWGLLYAAANPISHPSCRRSFSALSPSFDGELDRE